MTPLHVVAGLIALGAGAIALFAAKGSMLHRHSGSVFVGAMVVMTTTAALMGNVVGGGVTLYLVLTAWLTVTRPVAEVRPMLMVLMVAALAASGYLFIGGFAVLGKPQLPGDVPAAPIFLLAFATLLGGALDARVLWDGAIRGAARLARHLWRMTFALWIATASFFLGQAKVLPEPLRRIELLLIPVLVVAIMLFYWLARVLIRRDRAVAPGALR